VTNLNLLFVAACCPFKNHRLSNLFENI